MRGIRLVLCGLGLGVGACNTNPSPEPATYAAAPRSVTPSGFRLPEGSGCSSDVARLEAIIDNDLQTGHIAASVYKRMKAEAASASAACSAGRDAEASAMVAATRKRHGYPAG